MDNNGKILIYYKYIHLENPQDIQRQQKELCASLGLKGRILIATEGINATIGGSREAIFSYIQSMKNNPLFNDIDYKMSQGNQEHFPRLKVVVRHQIVHWGPLLAQSNPDNAGIHLEPHQTHHILSSDKNIVILDARNTYESRIGSFKDALKASIEKFRDLPEYIDQHAALLKDKKVIMYCTSGVRCERASAYLKSKNIAQEVYQMKGGIQRYTEHYPEGYFRGKNYVFDGRGAIQVNDDILTHCNLCNLAYDTYSNCMNAQCNEQFVGCPGCLQRYHQSCSTQCAELVEKRQVHLRKSSAHQLHNTDAKNL